MPGLAEGGLHTLRSGVDGGDIESKRTEIVGNEPAKLPIVIYHEKARAPAVVHGDAIRGTGLIIKRQSSRTTCGQKRHG
ncbi:hypothetical protein MASR2M8_20070 [Opitutaceae bacterium]